MSGKKHAYGYCDRTGFRYPLNELVEQYVNGRPTGLRVGRDMVDIDHEQLRTNEIDASEDQSLDNARPDSSVVESRALSAWNPVGGGVTELGTSTLGLSMTLITGQVIVETG